MTVRGSRVAYIVDNGWSTTGKQAPNPGPGGYCPSKCALYRRPPAKKTKQNKTKYRQT